ncbi:MAG: ATP-binding protein [Thermodesulfovibrionales bacterium]
MIIEIGRSKHDSHPVVFNSADVVNPHVMVVGTTGVGKTYTLRNIVSQIARHNSARAHVFDSQGDLGINPALQSAAKFSEVSLFGINPLEIDADVDFGGVRRSVARFLSMLDRYSATRLGERQQVVLRNLLYDLYAKHGYYYSKPESWIPNGKTPPTLMNLKTFVEEKRLALSIGGNNASFKAIESLADKLYKLNENGEQLSPMDAEEIAELKERYVDASRTFAESISTGREIKELKRYSDADLVQSVLNRIENLYHTGLFKNTPPMFAKTKPVWLYDIASLGKNEAGYLVEIYLYKVFSRSRQAGISPYAAVRQIFCIDEAQRYISSESDHIINTAVREGRKYGLSLVFASQNVDNFSKDIVSNCATKILLGIDETDHARVAKKFGLKVSQLKAIEPQHTALVQIKTKGNRLSNDFVEVVL